VCRVRPYPDWLDRCFAGLAANPEVYHTMNGPSEFHVIGPLKHFDVSAQLGSIEVPTLLFCGEFDEVTPATVAQAHDAIPGSQFVVLAGCSHMGQAERPDLTLGLVRGWLAGVESSLRRPRSGSWPIGHAAQGPGIIVSRTLLSASPSSRR